MPARRDMEHKDVPVFVISTDAKLGQVEAIVSVMGVTDLVDDIIHNGSYTKTIVERAGKIRVLDNHRTDSALAAIGHPLQIKELKRSELPAELLEKYPEATGGLWTLSQFDIDTPEGEGAFKRIVSGSLNEWSIGFDVLAWDKSTVTNADGKKIIVRNIREIRLWEYSLVLWGANQATWTVGAKGTSHTQGDLKMPAKTNKSKADAPNYQSAPAGYNRCSTCYFFDPSGNCTKYDFKADPDYICDSFKAGSGGKGGDAPAEGKEVEGIGKSMGSSLVSCVYDAYIAKVNYWLSDGDITIEEHRALLSTGGDLTDFLTSGISAEILNRVIEYNDPFMDLIFWAAEGAQQIKRYLSREQKAGRVLSQANATKLVTAVEQIQDVLTVAGIYDQAKEEDNSTEKGSQPTPEAEPQPALTLSGDDEHRKSLEAARLALAEIKGVKKDDVSGEHRTG